DVATDANGLYQAFYLNAGTYAVTAELSGFKRVSRPGNTVSVGEVSRVDITMEAGAIEETVTVIADVALLNTTTGISGTTVDSKQIAQLPLADGTAYMLTRLAPGIADASDLHRHPGPQQPARHPAWGPPDVLITAGKAGKAGGAGRGAGRVLTC